MAWEKESEVYQEKIKTQHDVRFREEIKELYSKQTRYKETMSR